MGEVGVGGRFFIAMNGKREREKRIKGRFVI